MDLSQEARRWARSTRRQRLPGSVRDRFCLSGGSALAGVVSGVKLGAAFLVAHALLASVAGFQAAASAGGMALAAALGCWLAFIARPAVAAIRERDPSVFFRSLAPRARWLAAEFVVLGRVARANAASALWSLSSKMGWGTQSARWAMAAGAGDRATLEKMARAQRLAEDAAIAMGPREVWLRAHFHLSILRHERAAKLFCQAPFDPRWPFRDVTGAQNGGERAFLADRQEKGPAQTPSVDFPQALAMARDKTQSGMFALAQPDEEFERNLNSIFALKEAIALQMAMAGGLAPKSARSGDSRRLGGELAPEPAANGGAAVAPGNPARAARRL